MPRRFQNFSVCFCKASATKTAEDSIDIFAYYLGNGFGMPRHFAKGYDLIFKQLRLFVLPNYIVYLWNSWMGETEETISLVDHLVLVSSYVFVMVGDRITQRKKNMVLKIWQCENKGKQCQLSDHWKSINDSNTSTGIQVLTKDFTSHKIR